jgi:hypothetical protein
MNYLKNRWNSWPPRRRLFLLALAAWGCAAWATFCLLRQDGLREVLYKAF